MKDTIVDLLISNYIVNHRDGILGRVVGMAEVQGLFLVLQQILMMMKKISFLRGMIVVLFFESVK